LDCGVEIPMFVRAKKMFVEHMENG
jgi:hypothetical protein